MAASKDLPRFVIWIDLVGGYLVCPADEVRVGQAATGHPVDVPLVADVSREHLAIRRDAEGYVVEALREAALNGEPLSVPQPLGDGDQLALGPVRLRFRRPHPLSATARLEFESPHRTRPTCDGVLLLADSCVLGPRPNSHVVCRSWPAEVVLFRQAGGLVCQSPVAFEIDGRRADGRGLLAPGSRVSGPSFSFWLEEIA